MRFTLTTIILLAGCYAPVADTLFNPADFAGDSIHKPGSDHHVDVDGAPLLEEAYPTEACLNSDQWISLLGWNLHSMSTVRIVEMATGARGDVPFDALDEHGHRLLEAEPTTEILVRAAPDFGLDAGDYEFSVVNPDGSESEAVVVTMLDCD